MDKYDAQLALYGDSLPKGGYTNTDKSFHFNSTDRTTTMRVSLPNSPAGVPHLVILSHGAAAQLGMYGLTAYEPLRKALCQTGLFGVISPLYEDGQDPTIGVTKWQECHAELYELVDRAGELGAWATGIGAMGHSFGSDRTAGTCGLQYSGGIAVIDQPKIKAMALWSPQGDDNRMVATGCWAGFEIPVLSITGLEDSGSGGDYHWRTQLHEGAPTSIERTLMLHRCDHDHGGAVGVPGHIMDQATADAVCDLTVAFFCAHLLNDSAAQRQLKQGATKYKSVLAPNGYEYLVGQ